MRAEACITQGSRTKKELLSDQDVLSLREHYLHSNLSLHSEKTRIRKTFVPYAYLRVIKVAVYVCYPHELIVYGAK